MIRRPPRSTLDRRRQRQMCIRDRKYFGGHSDILGGALVFKENNEKTAFIKKVQCYGAVSYTHLRAHETVLDLVCRLLLEKKKKK